MNGPDSRVDCGAGGADGGMFGTGGWVTSGRGRLSKRGALGASAYAFHGSQASSRRNPGARVGRAGTSGDAAGGSASAFGSGSAKEEERMSGGREGAVSEESLAELEAGLFVSRMETILDRVAFLRKKPAIASYGEVVGGGEKGGEGGKEVIKIMPRAFCCSLARSPLAMGVRIMSPFRRLSLHIIYRRSSITCHLRYTHGTSKLSPCSSKHSVATCSHHVSICTL